MQRVPTTEKKGRRHSSEVVVVWVEGDSTSYKLDPSEVREEFIRTSGKGGQNRNKVSSCVRLTHLPTGLQVVADGERKQHQNRVVAWKRLEEALSSDHDEAQERSTNVDRSRQFDSDREWVWTEWRDQVKGPSGESGSYKTLLKGRFSRVLR